MKLVNKIIGILVLVLVIMFITSEQSLAKTVGKDYMIIVAVGEFEKSNKLYATMDLSKDVKMIRDSFTKHKLRSNHEIIELINEKATKKRILDTIDSISSKLTSNDRFYFYFSGHGTSTSDLMLYNAHIKYLPSKNQQFLNDTSAILPYDFDVKNIEKTLIIGNTEFKKRIEAIDKKIEKAIVIIDACFSSHMVRAEHFGANFVGNQKNISKRTQVITNPQSGSKIKSGVSNTTKSVCNCVKQNKKLQGCVKNSRSY